MIYEVIVYIAGGVSAITIIMTAYNKLHKYFLKVDELEKDMRFIFEKEEKDIKEVSKHHDEDVAKMHEEENHEFKEVKQELQLLTYAVLACLKSLRDSDVTNNKEQVNDAIHLIEKHMNERAHD